MYNEKSIKILSVKEKESHSAISILETLLNEFPSTSPEHLERIAEMLIFFGQSVEHYRQYRKGKLSEDIFYSWNEWFKANA